MIQRTYRYTESYFIGNLSHLVRVEGRRLENLHTIDALPLEGVRVLELGNFIAAPFAARIFADFGAEVIKIEKPELGDEVRDWRTHAVLPL